MRDDLRFICLLSRNYCHVSYNSVNMCEGAANRPPLENPMKSSMLIFLWLLFLAQTSICSAQDFSVRLIDVGNGRPFPNQTVTIQYRKTAEGSLDFETFAIKTDVNGTVTFQLPPTPQKVSVTAYDLYPCYSLLPNDTRQLKEFGLTSHCSKPSQGCRCKFSNQANQVKARPGEVVLLARPMTHWEKFLRHIWE